MTLESFTRRFVIHSAIPLKTVVDFEEVQQRETCDKSSLQRNEP